MNAPHALVTMRPWSSCRASSYCPSEGKRSPHLDARSSACVLGNICFTRVLDSAGGVKLRSSYLKTHQPARVRFVAGSSICSHGFAASCRAAHAAAKCIARSDSRACDARCGVPDLLYICAAGKIRSRCGRVDWSAPYGVVQMRWG